MTALLDFLSDWLFGPSPLRQKIRNAYTLRVARKYGVNPSANIQQRVEDYLKPYRTLEGQ